MQRLRSRSLPLTLVVVCGIVSGFYFIFWRPIATVADDGVRAQRQQAELSAPPVVVAPAVPSAPGLQNSKEPSSALQPVVLNWSRINSKIDLRRALEAGLLTTDGEDAAVAIHLAALCVGADQQSASAEEIAAKRGSALNPIEISAATRHAHRAIVDLCQGVEWAMYSDRIKSRNLVIGPLLRQMVRPASGQRSQEYNQAAMQVLSNPERFSLAFDFWLDRNVASLAPVDFTTEQLAYAKEMLFKRFLPGAVENSLRDIERCRYAYYCGSQYGISDRERSQADAFVAAVEINIRQQRWSNLLSKPK